MKKWSSVAVVGLLALAACSRTTDGDSKEKSELRPADSDEAKVADVSEPEVAAHAYAMDRLTAAGFGRRSDLIAMSARLGAGGLTHVRMNQVIDGVRVFGGDVVVHTADGRVSGMGGNLGANLEGMDVTPALEAEAATATAKADFVGDAKGTFDYSREESELVILPREDGTARLAWQVKFANELQNGKNPGYWNYFIDAKTGEVLQKFNGIHTLAEASGPGGNAKVSRTWTNALDVEASGSSYVMDTARLKTVNMKNSQSGSGTVVSGPLDNIGDAPINDAHGFAEVTLNMLRDWMGYNSIDGNGFKIVSRVHYGNRYENAYWDGAQMTYGDGANTF
jgi:vibriolysin